MKKLCDSCLYYADMFNFCCVKYIETGKNLVDYCEEYVDADKSKNIQDKHKRE